MADKQIKLSEASEAAPTGIPEVKLPKLTTAAAWKESTRGRWLATLPSGHTVKIRRVDLMAMLAEDVISMDQFTDLNGPADGKEGFAKRTELARILSSHIVVDPPVALPNGTPPPDGSISADDIPPMDSLALLAWTLTGQTSMLELRKIGE